MIRMIVFDMAGTTVNEDNVVYKTLHQAVVNAGYEVSLETVLLEGAGKEKLQAITDILLYSKVNEEEVQQKAKDIYIHFLKMLDIAYNELNVGTYNGTEQVFKKLKEKEIKVVLNTGYNRDTAETLLNKLQWQVGKQIDLLITADDVSNGRPHPDMIQLAMGKMQIEQAQQVAKVGDSIIDIEEGKSAGCGLTFGVTTGAHTAQQLASAQPDHIIHSLEEITNLVGA